MVSAHQGTVWETDDAVTTVLSREDSNPDVVGCCGRGIVYPYETTCGRVGQEEKITSAPSTFDHEATRKPVVKEYHSIFYI